MISDNGKTFDAATKVLQDVKWAFQRPQGPR